MLRVVQLNAGSLLEPDWEARRHEIVAWLGQLEPDVVCLQEIWQSDTQANTAGWIVEQLGVDNWHWTFGGGAIDARFVPDPSVLFGSAVLSRWPITATEFHALPVADAGDPFLHATTWELLHARTADLDVFSTHLVPAPSDGRHRVVQVQAIDDIVKTTRGTQDGHAGFGARRTAMPAVICGDFNAEPDSDEIRFLSGLAVIDGRSTFYQDAWRVAGEGVGHTQDWRKNPIAANLNIHRKRIDYVFVGDPFMRAGDAGVEIAWPTRPLGAQ